MTSTGIRAWIGYGTSVVGACATAGVIIAHGASAATERQSESRGKPDRSITATGCLRESTRTAGATSSAPARGDTTSRGEDEPRAARPQYVLTNARVAVKSDSPGSDPSSQASGTGTAGATYLITGLEESSMRQFLGQEVEVRGRLTGSGRTPATESATAAGSSAGAGSTPSAGTPAASGTPGTQSGTTGTGRNTGTMGSTETASGDRSAAAGTTGTAMDQRDLATIHASSIKVVSPTCTVS